MTSKSIDKKDKHMPRRNWSRYHNLQNDSVEKIPLKNTKKRETQEKLSNLKSFPTKKKRNYYNPKEEARLERIVFGDPVDIIGNLTSSQYSIEKDKELGSDSNSNLSNVHGYQSIANNEEDIESACNQRRPVWIDKDDVDYTVKNASKDQNRRIQGSGSKTSYTALIRKEYKNVNETPKWAQFDREKIDSDDSDDEILKHSCHLKPTKLKNLPNQLIELKALVPINAQTHNEGPVVSSLEFHPSSTVALVAGISGILSIFQVDGITNNKLHSMQFEKFPISQASFLNEGTEVLVSSQYYNYCHSYDLISGAINKIPLPHNITNMKKYGISPDGKLIASCGRMGEIHLLSSKSKELISTMKMNKKCKALAFTPDGRNLVTYGDSNEMYVWDMNNRTCLNRAIDDGCLTGETISISPNGQFLATGSTQGVVNIYDLNSVLHEKEPKPLKIVLNLVTSITGLKFNPSSEILAMASNKKPNAFKMVHIPSFGVFSNFPTFQTQINMPEAIDFSPGSGYLGLSNRSFNAFMFKLKHYGNY